MSCLVGVLVLHLLQHFINVGNYSLENPIDKLLYLHLLYISCHTLRN